MPKNDNIEPIDGKFDAVAKSMVTSGGAPPPRALYKGILPIGEGDLDCVILDDKDKTRVIMMTSVFKAFGRVARSNNRVINVPAFIDAKNLQDYINQDVKALIKPIEYFDGKTIQIGYNALILPEICDLYLQARRDGKLAPKQAHLAEKAEILQSSFAKVGIIALVDEATGFQYERESDALQQILEKFLNDERRIWSKTFPDEFWQKLVKIKGYDSYLALKRPSFVGHWVNDIVYSRLAPGIKDKLTEINPRTVSGNRKGKHHQHLTDDHGLPELKDHLKKVMVLMDASSSKKEFEKLLDKSLPKYGSNLELPYGDKP